jgi:hypothetical protein
MTPARHTFVSTLVASTLVLIGFAPAMAGDTTDPSAESSAPAPAVTSPPGPTPDPSPPVPSVDPPKPEEEPEQDETTLPPKVSDKQPTESPGDSFSASAAVAAMDDNYATDLNTDLHVAAPGLLANDPSGSTVLSTTAGDTSGVLSGVGSDGSFSYSPPDDFHGTDTFTYTTAFGTATVTITVGPPAVDDSYTTVMNTDLHVPAPGLLANDPSGSTVLSVTAGDTSGVLSGVGSDGSFDYSPPDDFHGTDTFTYTTAFGTATVTITVNPAPPAPVANADSYTLDAGQTLTVSAGDGVLTNDTNATGVTPSASNTAHGTVTLNANGSFAYTPVADYSGPDAFTYTATGPGGTSAPATVSITVNEAAPPAPVGNADSYETDEGVTLVVPAADGVLDNDLNATSATQVSPVPAGDGFVLFSPTGGGAFSFFPNAGFVGTTSFSYTASGPGGTTAPVTVTITVNDVAPIATDDSYDVEEDETLTVDPPGVLTNDIGYTGARLVSGVSHGELDFDEDGSFTYTPDDDYAGADEFTYVATDEVAVGQGGRAISGGLFTLDSAPANVAINVIADDDGSDDDDSDDDDDGDSDDGDDNGRNDDSDAALPDTGSPIGPAHLPASVVMICIGGVLLAATRTRDRGKHAS